MNKYDVIGSYVTRTKDSEVKWFDEVVEAKTGKLAIKKMWKMIRLKVAEDGDEVRWFNRTFAYQKTENC